MATAVEQIRKIIEANKGIPEEILSDEITKVEDGEFKPYSYRNGCIAFGVSPIKLDIKSYKKWVDIAKRMGYSLEERKEPFYGFTLKKDIKYVADLYNFFFVVPANSEPQLVEDIGRKFYGLKTAKEIEK